MAERAVAEILEGRAVSSRGRRNPRAVKRKMSGFPTKLRAPRPAPLRKGRIRVLDLK